MFDRDLETLTQISDTMGKIALEVALAQPGRDSGLLPVNCLLFELKDRAARLPPAIASSLDQAVAVVDRVFETTGVFDETAIKELGDWVNWVNEALLDALNDRPIKPYSGTAASAAPSSDAPAEPELKLDLEVDGALLAEFCHESREHLANIEQGVLVLEKRPADPGTLNTIFRAFHTFKGGAGLLNLQPIRELAHELENVLDQARARKLTVDKAVIDLILAGGDTLKQFIDQIGGQLAGHPAGSRIVVPTRDLLARARAVSSGGNASLPSELTASFEVNSNELAPPPSSGADEEAVSKPAVKSSTSGKSPVGSVVKVDTLKLDSLIDLVGELVIAQSQVCQDGDLAALESPRLNRNLARLARITRELQRTAMALRMVPIRATFHKMTRLVRDLSGRLGKRVELVLHGEDTELDRIIVEEIGDPLIHMMRNGVDHGIEPPDERVRAGKVPVGMIHLSAFHKGGNVVVEMRDDGRGLNPDQLRAKALERGIIGERDHLSDKEACALIFAAGFSTAGTVTDVSGRGVGMDVVRRNVEKLRGKIEVESVSGKGTAFTISLPLTLAIIDGLIVAIGDQRFIIPTLSVRESFRPTREMITTVHERGELVSVRGRLSPLLRLHEFFDIKPRHTDPTEALLVVVDYGGETRCLMVDRLLGRQEVVIKSLGETFKKVPAIAGGAILGDGGVGLIIDANALVNPRGFETTLAA